jgi:hypothetical protein
MREVPMRFIKANQTGIVLLVIVSFFYNQMIVLALLWAIQVVGLLSGGKLNLFVTVYKLFSSNKGTETQAVELQRFNNVLAIIFLTLATGSLLLGWVVSAYVFSIMLLGAASAALLGYCVGCTIYFWYKQFRAGRKIWKTNSSK